MIVTFYSYKGGVGRSMALANVADLLARSGLRVLMVDFDLEAPGLEHFFPIDHEAVRGHEGLLDLLLTFKYSMSTASSGSEERDAFRRLERFVATVYPFRDGAGGIDLLPAGKRLTDEQIGRYGEELRRFDWVDFYFSWSGELFFEWLRRTFAERYDAILVDSRTGVTEMGGVCAYQLADAIVVLCAPNLQNVEGTEAMVRHFLSPQVRAVRGERPVDVLIVPARVDQEDTSLRGIFQRRFQERFARYQPVALTSQGLTLWDLQIPYEPRYAFDEQVVTDPGRADERKGLAAAYGKLLDGIALIAPDDSRLATVRSTPSPAATQPPAEPVLTQYDPTTRFAAADVFISFGHGSEQVAAEIREQLQREGFLVAMSPDPRVQDAGYSRAFLDLIQGAKVGLVLVGPEGDRSAWRDRELAELVAPPGRHSVVTVLLPGGDPDQVPPFLRARTQLDFRTWSDLGWEKLLATVRMAVIQARSASSSAGATERNPYRGLAPFRESEQDIFVGRELEVEEVLGRIRNDGACSIVGPAGIGKTSLIHAGLVPILRRGALPGSERWPLVSVRPGDQPTSSLVAAIARSVGVSDLMAEMRGDGIDSVLELLGRRFERVLLVIDQFEELFTRTDTIERQRLIRDLTELCGRAQELVVPVVAVRLDFLDEAMDTPGLARLLFSSPILIGPLNDEELRAAIEVPARRLGIALEPGLADRLLADVAGEPAALTLLQFVLDELWRDQRDGYLRHASYERLGGAAHGLANHADAAIGYLSFSDQEIARKVLLQLVELEVDGRARRRRPVEVLELTGREGVLDVSKVRHVVEQLIDQRLLATSAANGQLRVELAHDELIETWPRLKQWIDESRGTLEARSRLDEAAREWWALERDPALLLTPERLEQLLPAIHDLPLTQLEHEYVVACQDQARTRRKRASRRVGLVSSVAALLGAALTAIASLLSSSAGVSNVVVFAVAGLVAGGVFLFSVLRGPRDQRKAESDLDN